MTAIGHAAPTAHEETVHGTGHTHPGDGTYVVVALVLAFLTALEVSLFYIDIGDAAVPALLILMVIKFATVVMWFMHLKFDSRMFTRLFVAGLVLAVAVYLAFLCAFQFFGDDTVTDTGSLGGPAAARIS